MKVLITGSNGLLGQKLIELLDTKSDVEVIATSSGENRLPKNSMSYTFHSLDITDKRQVNGVMEKFGPDIVVNTAAMTNVDQCETDRQGCWDLNVHAVENLVEACVKKTIIPSSSVDRFYIRWKGRTLPGGFKTKSH